MGEQTEKSSTDFLNEKFFEKVIESHLNLSPGDYEITKVEKTEIGSEDSVLSNVFRSKIEYSRNGSKELLRCFAKIVTTSVPFPLIFEMERKMYTEIIPALEKLFADVDVEVKFGPKLYYVTSEPAKIIVLEDLSDFEMIHKHIGLDKEHTENSLSLLAKFHAASMILGKSHGNFSNGFEPRHVSMINFEFYQPFLDSHIDPFKEALKDLPNGKKHVEKVEAWRTNLLEKECKTLEYDENAFNVLNHGDLWSNNLMFKYNDNRSSFAVKLVDFQFCFWGSVAYDLFYFMISSWKLDIKVKKFDELINIYFDELVKNLILLKYEKLPTLDDLLKELDRRKFLASAFCMYQLPFPLSDFSFNDDRYKTMLYENSRIKLALAEVFNWLVERNAFDYSEDSA